MQVAQAVGAWRIGPAGSWGYGTSTGGRMVRVVLLLLLFGTVTLVAQPATEEMTLRSFELQVPEKFADLYQDAADSVLLPEGFTIEVFQAGLQLPRFMAWSPQGVLHVVEQQAHRIIALPDRDRDGVADTVITVAAPV